jgi:1,4-dihydroxy-2-naphthoate polyprenyltransferase
MNIFSKEWIGAARVKTLPAAFSPVLIGAALAFAHSQFSLVITMVALFCALLIQIGTNFANDYYDFVKGADTTDRVGFVRSTASGVIQPGTMLSAAWIVMGLAFVSGLYLVWHGGMVILLIGILSIGFGIIYTGGPFPLAYNGLGDLFVFIFFGFVAVTGTYYVNTLEFNMQAFWASISAGSLTTSILVVNNLRDTITDKTAGKKTLGVRFGDKFLKIEFLILMALAYAIPPHFHFQEGFGQMVMLPLLLIPVAGFLVFRLWAIQNKSELNSLLGQTAIHLLLFSILFAVGIIIG